MIFGGEETNIQSASFRFRTGAADMQEVGCAIGVAMSRVLRQQNLGHRVRSHSIEVCGAIVGP
jgi:hypothetical protein